MYKKAILVLGCGIDSIGNLNPDAEGSARIALDCLRDQPDSYIIMTGSVSYKAEFKPSVSEAQAMKDYAISLGTPQNKIFVETESKDTMGNLYFTKLNLLIPLGIKDVTIVRGPNQSDERIEYLATKILGDDYNFKVIGPNIQRPSEKEREQKSLDMAKRWLNPINNGDMPAIYSLMRERHPGYNSSLGLDELEELL